MIDSLIGTASLLTRRYLLGQSEENSLQCPVIFHVINSLNRGGAESMLLALANHQKSVFRPVIISLMKEGALTERVRSMGVECHHLNFRRNHPDIFGMIKLIHLIRTLKPAVVQGWMYHGDLASFLALFFSGPCQHQPTMVAFGNGGTGTPRHCHATRQCGLDQLSLVIYSS